MSTTNSPICTLDEVRLENLESLPISVHHQPASNSAAAQPSLSGTKTTAVVSNRALNSSPARPTGRSARLRVTSRQPMTRPPRALNHFTREVEPWRIALAAASARRRAVRPISPPKPPPLSDAAASAALFRGVRRVCGLPPPPPPLHRSGYDPRGGRQGQRTAGLPFASPGAPPGERHLRRPCCSLLLTACSVRAQRRSILRLVEAP
jgi:hypothetical protein